jgi:hypothetical protein
MTGNFVATVGNNQIERCEAFVDDGDNQCDGVAVIDVPSHKLCKIHAQQFLDELGRAITEV